MDASTLILIAVGAGLALLVLVFMLNRAWGNFPSRPSLTPSHLPSESQRRPWGEQPPSETDVDQGAFDDLPPDAVPDLVPLRHPMVLKAAESALQRGGDPARHLVRQGDQIYLSLQSLPDPAQRRLAWEMFRRFDAGEDIDVRVMLTVLRQIFRS